MLGASSQYELEDQKEVKQHDQAIVVSKWPDQVFLDSNRDFGERAQINGGPDRKLPKINLLFSYKSEFVVKQYRQSTPDISEVAGVHVQHAMLPKV